MQPRHFWLRTGSDITRDWVTFAGTMVSKRVAAEFIQAFPDMRISVEDAPTDGEKMVRRVSWTATHAGSFLGIPSTSKRVSVRETIILRVVDGKIAEEWQMGDILGLLQQLGAAPLLSLDSARPTAGAASTPTET
jgi:predicted ester cyclase